MSYRADRAQALTIGFNAAAVDISAADHVFDKPVVLWIGVTGDVVVKAAGNDAEVTIKNVPSGRYLPFAVTTVVKTGTDATEMVAWW